MAATSYPRDGKDWRGRFIADMVAHLGRQEGVQLSLWAPPGELPNRVTSAATAADAAWLERMAAAGGIAHLLRTQPLKAALTGLTLLVRLRRALGREKPALAHINWLQNALALAGSRTPAVITVLGSDFSLLRYPGMVAALRAVLKGRCSLIAPNAGWMVPELRRHFGDLARIQSIPFGVEQRWFAIQRQGNAPGGKRWLVVSRVTRAKLGYLLEWGQGAFGDGRELHLFGPMQEPLSLPDWIRYHGPTHPVALAEEWFPRACGLLTLSRHDEGRPQVMIEAMAAGLPVIATDLAAHRDLLIDQATGRLVNTPAQFIQALADLEDMEENLRIGSAARDWVIQNIGTWDDCARRFTAAYVAVTAP